MLEALLASWRAASQTEFKALLESVLKLLCVFETAARGPPNSVGVVRNVACDMSHVLNVFGNRDLRQVACVVNAWEIIARGKSNVFRF